MKTIGLLGGMSWESTVTYYQHINKAVQQECGGLHCAKIVLYSVDFAEIEQLQANGAWDRAAWLLTGAAQALERAGADFIAICTNTMHKVVPQIEPHLRVPILHIAQATAEQLQRQRIAKVALLGTKYTMTQNFYTDKIKAAGIEPMVPNPRDIEYINRVIYEELCRGIISDASRQALIQIIAELGAQGAQGAILGCTEIGLLIRQADTQLPIFDTTKIHADKIAMYSLEK